MVINFSKHQKIIRFVLVGSINTIVDIGLFTLLVSGGTNIVLANICSTSAGLIVSFTLNRHYTFKVNGAELKHQLIRFFPVTLFGLWAVQPAVILLVRHVADTILNASYWPDSLNAPAVIPKLIATAVSLIWNYLWYSHFVFVSASDPDDHQSTR